MPFLLPSASWVLQFLRKKEVGLNLNTVKNPYKRTTRLKNMYCKIVQIPKTRCWHWIVQQGNCEVSFKRRRPFLNAYNAGQRIKIIYYEPPLKIIYSYVFYMNLYGQGPQKGRFFCTGFSGAHTFLSAAKIWFFSQNNGAHIGLLISQSCVFQA